MVIWLSIASLSVRASFARNWSRSSPNPPTICFGSVPRMPTNAGPLLSPTVTVLPDTLNSLTVGLAPWGPGVATTVAVGLPSFVSTLRIA